MAKTKTQPVEETPEVEQITKEEVVNLYVRLGEFDGRRRRIGEGDQTEIITEPFDLEMGVRWDLALNRSTLKPFYDSIMNARGEVIKQVTGGKRVLSHKIKDEDGKEVANPLYAEFMDKYTVVLQEKINCPKLIMIDRKKLNMDKNRLGITLLDDLMPMLIKE